MITPSYLSRREVEQQHFSLAVTTIVPLLAILLQVMLPLLSPRLTLVDLPLVVTLFFAISRRSPIAGTATGAAIGLVQDVLTGQPIGIDGMAKAVVGYSAASLSSRIDVDNPMTRALLTFGFSLLHSGLLWLIERRLLGIRDFHELWLRELIRGVVNTAVAVPLFAFLDRWRQAD